MAKPELGTKRLCPSCGAKYYDLNRDPITCPKCGTVFETVMTARAAKAAKAAEKPEEEDDDDDVTAPDTVPLEEADAETEDTGEVVPDLEDAEVDVDDDDATDDGVFIDDEDEDEDEVPPIRVEIDEDPDR
ncbi:TIGR02300 family protein [uncultured Roseibium sp.]|uniref:TIGR02300 family protein n=1 Tax=uncultured Roseibium sp. TaxID=1936171 RepID=UPI00261A6EF3|nr:TIGR02300 family protein [uncultured Roseibium sp.]